MLVALEGLILGIVVLAGSLLRGASFEVMCMTEAYLVAADLAVEKAAMVEALRWKQFLETLEGKPWFVSDSSATAIRAVCLLGEDL